MINNKQKKVYILMGAALGLIAGIYHRALKEIIQHEVTNKSSGKLDEEAVPPTDSTKN